MPKDSITTQETAASLSAQCSETIVRARSWLVRELNRASGAEVQVITLPSTPELCAMVKEPLSIEVLDGNSALEPFLRPQIDREGTKIIDPCS